MGFEVLDGVEKTIAISLLVIVIISTIFVTGNAFFPNWSSIPAAPAIVGTAMALVSAFVIFVLITTLIIPINRRGY